MVRKVIDLRVSLFVRVGRRRGKLRLNFDDDDDVAKKKRKFRVILLGTGSEGLWDLYGFVIVGNGMGSCMPVFEDTCVREWERRSSPPRDLQIAEQYYLDARKDSVLLFFTKVESIVRRVRCSRASTPPHLDRQRY